MRKINLGFGNFSMGSYRFLAWWATDQVTVLILEWQIVIHNVRNFLGEFLTTCCQQAPEDFSAIS